MGIEEKKKKQAVMLIMTILLLIAAIFMVVYKLQRARHTKQVQEEKTTVEFSEKGSDAEKKWLAEREKELGEIKSQLKQISRILNDINNRISSNEKRIKELEKKVKIQKQTTKPLKKEEKESKTIVEKTKKKAKFTAPPPPPPPPPPAVLSGKTKGKKAQVVGIQRISFEQDLKKREKKVEEKKFEILRKFYIPSGTFVEGILLSGVDAPTGMGAKKDTIPVLINLVDNSILPNDWKYDLKDCRVIGEAYGDLSSERVYIRTDYMSCVDDDGNVYDFTLDGYVAGEDGKVGLRGRVVSKQGALIARALLAGFFEGAGNILETSATSTTITGSGVVSTVEPGKVARAGIFGGTAEAAKKLSDYFMKLLDQTFPVVEIGAGRKVTIVIQKGKWIQKVGRTEEVERKSAGSDKGGKK